MELSRTAPTSEFFGYCETLTFYETIHVGTRMSDENKSRWENGEQGVEITIRLPAELAGRLKNYAETRRVTVDDLAERLIGRFLNFVSKREVK
jgi:hypothetical protein